VHNETHHKMKLQIKSVARRRSKFTDFVNAMEVTPAIGMVT
jgi:hypothetical protein